MSDFHRTLKIVNEFGAIENVTLEEALRRFDQGRVPWHSEEELIVATIEDVSLEHGGVLYE